MKITNPVKEILEGERRWSEPIIFDEPAPVDQNMVDHPPHYTQGSMEVIDFIEAVLDTFVHESLRYHVGNVIKYICRAPYKNGQEDLKKALWYAERALDKTDYYTEVTHLDVTEELANSQELVRFMDEVRDSYSPLLAPSIFNALFACCYPYQLSKVVDELTFAIAQAKSINKVV